MEGWVNLVGWSIERTVYPQSGHLSTIDRAQTGADWPFKPALVKKQTFLHQQWRILIRFLFFCPPLCDIVPRSLLSPPSIPFPCKRGKSFDLLQQHLPGDQPAHLASARQTGGPVFLWAQIRESPSAKDRRPSHWAATPTVAESLVAEKQSVIVAHVQRLGRSAVSPMQRPGQRRRQSGNHPADQVPWCQRRIGWFGWRARQTFVGEFWAVRWLRRFRAHQPWQFPARSTRQPHLNRGFISYTQKNCGGLAFSPRLPSVARPVEHNVPIVSSLHWRNSI